MKASSLWLVASVALASCAGGGGGTPVAPSLPASNPNGGQQSSPPGLPKSYALVDLGANVSPSRLNASGAIVGSLQQGQHQVAFLFQNGALTKLGMLSGDTDSAAFDINDSGAIVGQSSHLSDTQQDPRAVRFTPGGAPFFLGTFQNQASVATAVNNAGEIVGGSFDVAFACPGILLNHLSFDGHGGVTQLNTGGGSYPVLNGGGTLGLAVFTTGGGGCGGYFVPSTYPPLTTLPLPANFPGGRNTNTVSDINDAGDVVGSYHVGPPPVDGTSGFFFHAGTTQEIDAPGGPDQTILNPLAINNGDEIVGEYGHGLFNTPFSAFVWLNGKVTDLNTLLPASCASWKLQSANDVNDNGEIVGTGTLGGVPHGFLLIPQS